MQYKTVQTMRNRDVPPFWYLFVWPSEDWCPSAEFLSVNVLGSFPGKFGVGSSCCRRYLSLHNSHNRSILRYLSKQKDPQPICLAKSVRIIAMSESQLVLIPVDGSDHSERAFECEYIASNMYVYK